MATSDASFKFSPRILDHLGISAYNSLKKCLTELVANSYDADATEVNIILPDAINETSVIEIKDNGCGMSPQQIKDNYLFIGKDRREEGQRTDKKRLVIGNKGIGKLAGFGIASKINVVTRKGKEQSVFTLNRGSFDNLVAVSSIPIKIAISPTEHSSGTEVRLSSINPNISLPSPEALRRHLYKHLPQRPDFKITVNNVECTAEDVPGSKYEINQEIEGVGKVAGFYVVANSRQKNPGLSVRVRGRIVTEPSLFDLDTKTHGFFTAEKIVGEVDADFLDPEQPEETPYGLINTSRNGFLEDSPKVEKFEEWAKELLKSIVKGVDKTETNRRTDALLEKPSIRERLERMPPHVRSTATKVIKGLIVKLKNVDEDEAADLIEWILRYYESNILRELMRAIISADLDDAERLATLVQEWGLKQLHSVVDLIKGQIEIITKMEELTSSQKAKEIDLHRLIEQNLWLVKEGLELWSSDKPLKSVLEANIDEAYKDKENLRPDLVCRSRDGGTEAVILEFKRPKEKIVMEHVTQALNYESIIASHRPGIRFETFIVGREYDPSVLVAREKLGGASLYLWSYEEILQKARIRFEKVLEILGLD